MVSKEHTVSHSATQGIGSGYIEGQSVVSFFHPPTEGEKVTAENNAGQDAGSKAGFWGQVLHVVDITKSSDFHTGFVNGVQNPGADDR